MNMMIEYEREVAKVEAALRLRPRAPPLEPREIARGVADRREAERVPASEEVKAVAEAIGGGGE